MYYKRNFNIINYRYIGDNILKKIVFTGGGTAGHVTPNISIVEKLKNEYEIHYIGSVSGIEKDIISRYPFIIYHPITTVKLERKLTPKNLLIPFKLLKGINDSRKILKSINPNIIFSKGGFVSVPVAFAGKSLDIPIVAHESDYTMGLANKLVYRKCKTMCFSFKDTCSHYQSKGLFTGTPLREQLFHGNKKKIIDTYNITSTKPVILVFGGSLGARAINNAIASIISNLTKKFTVIHIVGKMNKNTKINQKDYYQVEFVDNIEDYFAIADIVISRAGSNSIFELCALKKPMLLIPLPKDSSRGDQILNAKYLSSKNLCKVLYQEDMTSSTLLDAIETIYRDRHIYISNLSKEKSFNGADKIIAEIKKYS